MSDTVETVKIVDAKAPGGHVIINKSDFNKDTQVIYDEAAALKAQKAADAKAAAELKAKADADKK